MIMIRQSFKTYDVVLSSFLYDVLMSIILLHVIVGKFTKERRMTS